MRTVTCVFFAVATRLLGDIRAGVGQSSDAVPILAAFIFLIAAVAFAFLDWPGLPNQGVEVPVEDRA